MCHLMARKCHTAILGGINRYCPPIYGLAEHMATNSRRYSFYDTMAEPSLCFWDEIS